MKHYKDTMDNLRFTPEQKAHMTDRLMEAAGSSHRRSHTFRRGAVVGVAAALALSVGVAGATGVLEDVGKSFSAIFGASATSGGITITADAIVGDTYSYAVVYTIQREDGEALVSDDVLARASDTAALPLTFQSQDATPRDYKGGSHARRWFYDADPADNAIQFVELRTQDIPLEPGELAVQFQDLELYNQDYTARTTLAEGSWTLNFQLNFENSSRVLPCGQTFQLKGTPVTLNSVTLSPLSLQVDYTVHWTGDPSTDWIHSLPLSITYTDGTTLDLSYAGGFSTPEEDAVSCRRDVIFDSIRPLEEVASVTVGDVVIPVSQ